MHDAKFRHLLAVEYDRRACATLRLNRAVDYAADSPWPQSTQDKWPLIEGDIHGVDFTPWKDEVTAVVGGVPCQPWSLGGVHKGYDDPRNLWPELFRCVRETRPEAVIAENVKGLLRPTFKPYYEYILRELGAPFEQRVDGEDWQDHDRRLIKIANSPVGDPSERYDVKYLLVNAADYGVPQVRWRVFVVAFRRDLRLSDWEFPAPTHSELALRRSQDNGDYWHRHGIPRPAEIAQTQLSTDDRLPWLTLRDAISDLPEPLGDYVEHPDWQHHQGWPGARQYPGHTPNHLDRPAKTVKAGVHGVPGGESVLLRDDGSIRYMTVRETARVMTFPDTWRLDGPRGEQMRQLGNAVPVRLAAAIAGAVATALTAIKSGAEKR